MTMVSTCLCMTVPGFQHDVWGWNSQQFGSMPLVLAPRVVFACLVAAVLLGRNACCATCVARSTALFACRFRCTGGGRALGERDDEAGPAEAFIKPREAA